MPINRVQELIPIIHRAHVLESHTELASTERSVLGGNIEVGFCKPLVTSTHKTVLCVFLFKDNIFHIYCGFTDSKLTAESSLTQAQTKLSNMSFLQKARPSLLALRNTPQHFRTTAGDR